MNNPEFSHNPEEVEKTIDFPTNTVLILKEGQTALTSPELVGCRVVIMDDGEQTITSHYGPMENQANLKSLENLKPKISHEKIDKIIIYTLDLTTTPEGFLKISNLQYGKNRNDLSLQLLKIFPNAELIEKTYDAHSNLEVTREDNKTYVKIITYYK